MTYQKVLQQGKYGKQIRLIQNALKKKMLAKLLKRGLKNAPETFMIYRIGRLLYRDVDKRLRTLYYSCKGFT